MPQPMNCVAYPNSNYTPEVPGTTLPRIYPFSVTGAAIQAHGLYLMSHPVSEHHTSHPASAKFHLAVTASQTLSLLEALMAQSPSGQGFCFPLVVFYLPRPWRWPVEATLTHLPVQTVRLDYLSEPMLGDLGVLGYKPPSHFCP